LLVCLLSMILPGKCSSSCCFVLRKSGHQAAQAAQACRISHTCFEHYLVDLAVSLDDVNLASNAVGECGDLPCALAPAHCSGGMVESFNKDDSLVGGHGKAMGKCLVVECFAPLLKNG
jgi:hypothetical protein